MRFDLQRTDRLSYRAPNGLEKHRDRLLIILQIRNKKYFHQYLFIASTKQFYDIFMCRSTIKNCTYKLQFDFSRLAEER